MRPASLLACVGAGLAIVLALTGAACAGPPNTEMDQAEGAIEAARAAGAAQYAAAELTAAQDALQRAVEAVDARDYRLALNYALESREEAQNAARVAAGTRERLRGELERTLAELTALLTRTRDRLGATGGTRVERRAREAALETLTGLDGRLQEAGTMLETGDYAGARTLLDEIRAQIEATAEPPSAAP